MHGETTSYDFSFFIIAIIWSNSFIVVSPSEHARQKLIWLDEYRHSLDTLLDIITTANLPAVSDAALAGYRGVRTRQSDAFQILMEQQSTIASQNHHNMSNFELSCLDGESRVDVKLIQLDSSRVRDYVIEMLFSNVEEQYQIFINEMKGSLDKLRRMFQYINQRRVNINESSFFQPIITMFLERFRDGLGNHWSHANGSNRPYKLNVHVKEEDEVEPREIELTGKPDIYFYDGEVLEIKNEKFQVELKGPFGVLFHSLGDKAKNQLICELMGQRDMLGDSTEECFGVLTDLFRIALGFNFHHNPKQFYLCQSVIDMDDYLNYLALMFCADNMKEKTVKKFASDSSGPKTNRRKRKDPDSKKNAYVYNTRSKARGRQTSATNQTIKATRNKQTSGKKKKLVCYFGSELEDIEAADRALELWYAEHFNQLCLTSENLHKNAMFQFF